MRLDGTLIFSLQILVNTIIVCSGGGILSSLVKPRLGLPYETTIKSRVENHNGIFYWEGKNHFRQLEGIFRFYKKDNLLTGWAYDTTTYQPVRAMCDNEGYIVVFDLNDKQYRPIDANQVKEFGITANLPPARGPRRQSRQADETRRA